MKKIIASLMLLVFFFVSGQGWAQVESAFIDADALGIYYDAKAIAAGTVFASSSSVTMKAAYDCDYRAVRMCGELDPFQTVVINGVEYANLPVGVQGQTNPTNTKDAYTQQPMNNAIFQFDVTADGVLYVVSKFSANKQYYVFEGAYSESKPSSSIAYTILGGSQIDGKTYRVKLPGDKDGHADYSGYAFAETIGAPFLCDLMGIREGETVGTTTFTFEDQKSSVLGVIAFPVYKKAGTYYLMCVGSKIPCDGFVFVPGNPKDILSDQEDAFIDADALGINDSWDYPAHVAAGTVLASSANVTMKAAYDCEYRAVPMCGELDPFQTVVINGVEYANLPVSVQGVTNPTNTKNAYTQQPMDNAIFQFDVTADGVLYVVSKFSANKQYYVFEGAYSESKPSSSIAYTILGGSQIDGKTYRVELPSDKDGHADYSGYAFAETIGAPFLCDLMGIREGETVGTTTFTDEQKSAVLGVIAFPVYKKAGTYYLMAVGSKIPCDGYVFVPGTHSVLDVNTKKIYTLYGDDIVKPASTLNFDNWISDNAGKHSTISRFTYNFQAKKNSVFSFDWSVESEQYCDYFTVSLDGSQIMSKSGFDTGSYSKTFASDGNHTVEVAYSKDGSVNAGQDMAIVRNVKLVSPSSIEQKMEHGYLTRKFGVSYMDWTSTNKTHSSISSNVIEIKAQSGDKLSFDWETSSELDADMLNIYLDGVAVVNGVSGNGTRGSFVQDLTAGHHTLYMEYVKDDAKSRYNDEVYVRNVEVKYPMPKSIVEQFTLRDGIAGIEVYEDFEAVNLCYNRTFNNTTWQALYLPFSLDYEDWSEDFDVAFINAFHQYDRNADGVMDDSELEVVKITNGSLYPNYPYLIRAKQVGNYNIESHDVKVNATRENTIACSSMTYNYSFTGAYNQISGSTLLSNGGYFLGGGQLIRPASGSSNLKPLRWYMNMESRDATYDHAAATIGSIRIRVQGEDFDENDAETAIESIAFDENYNSVENIYSIDGRRVKSDKLEKGIYIVGDKKVMIK